MPGQPVPVLRHIPNEKLLPDIKIDAAMFHCGPIASGSTTGHSRRDFDPIVFTLI